MKVRDLRKRLAKLDPDLVVLVRGRDDDDYPFVELDTASEEEMLFNGDHIVLDQGVDFGENYTKGKAVVLSPY